MDIVIKNDKKEKHQSYEATLSRSGSDAMGYHDTTFVGFGANEHEAKESLVQQVDNLIKNLKRIKDIFDS